jgi:hypothetical protein
MGTLQLQSDPSPVPPRSSRKQSLRLPVLKKQNKKREKKKSQRPVTPPPPPQKKKRIEAPSAKK